MSESRIKVLLDTDIGTDIDDAVCLAYLLANPRCDLLGITTVTGEPVKRAMLASALCLRAGRNIPIYPGSSSPMLISQQQQFAAQASALECWDHKKYFPKGEAVEFLRKTIREHPHEIMLLTIGPLTNIGLLFKVDPEIPSLLKGLILMCGYFYKTLPGIDPLEWNARGDPHATSIVYRSKVAIHRTVGLDVTTRVTMDSKRFRETFSDFNLYGPILDFATVWFDEWDGLTFHDPLAATTIFNDGICDFEKGMVSIELDNKENLGETQCEAQEKGPHEIASKVNRNLFFKEYLSVFQ